MKIRLKEIFSLIILIAIGFWSYNNQAWFVRQYHKLCGVYYIHKGDKEYSKLHLDKAISNYAHGLDLYPQHYTAWFNLGNIYVVYEDFFSALDAYEKAIANNPKMMIARMNYGIIAAEKLGNFDDAIKQYEEIIKTKRHLISIPFVYSNRKSYKVNRGIAYYNMGIAYRQKSLYVHNDDALRYEYLKKAIDAYKEAVKILQTDYDATYNLALTYQLIGNDNEAGRNYCKAIQLEPMKYEAHYNLAILLRHLKYYKESLSELEKATTLITDEEGISSKQQYIFQIMNDVTTTLIADNERKKENIEENSNKITPTFSHGKIIASEALDKAILESFSKCESLELFVNNNP